MQPRHIPVRSDLAGDHSWPSPLSLSDDAETVYHAFVWKNNDFKPASWTFCRWKVLKHLSECSCRDSVSRFRWVWAAHIGAGASGSQRRGPIQFLHWTWHTHLHVILSRHGFRRALVWEFLVIVFCLLCLFSSINWCPSSSRFDPVASSNCDMLFWTISSERSSGCPLLLSTDLIEFPAVAFSHCGLLFWVVSSVYFFGCTLGASIFARLQFVFSASSLRWVCSQFWPTFFFSSTNFASVSVCVRDGPSKWSSSWIFAFVSRHFSAIHVVLSSCISSLFCCERVAHVICKLWTVVCGIAAVSSPAAIKLKGKWIWAIFGLLVKRRPSWETELRDRRWETTLRPRWDHVESTLRPSSQWSSPKVWPKVWPKVRPPRCCDHHVVVTTTLLWPPTLLWPRCCDHHAVVTTTLLWPPRCCDHHVVVTTTLLWPPRCCDHHVVVTTTLLWPPRCGDHHVLWPHVLDHVSTFRRRLDHVWTTFGPRCDQGEIAVRLRWDCGEFTVRLRWYYGETTVRLRWDYGKVEVRLRWYLFRDQSETKDNQVEDQVRPGWDQVEDQVETHVERLRTTLRPSWDQDETNMRLSWDLGETKLRSIFKLRPCAKLIFSRWHHVKTKRRPSWDHFYVETKLRSIFTLKPWWDVLHLRQEWRLLHSSNIEARIDEGSFVCVEDLTARRMILICSC